MPSPRCGRPRHAPRIALSWASATSDGGGLVVRTDEGVGIQLGAVVERVKQNLIDRGLGAAELIPTDRQGDHPRRRRQPRDDPHELRRRERRSGYWLPFITLALFAPRHPHRPPPQRRRHRAPASASRSAAPIPRRDVRDRRLRHGIAAGCPGPVARCAERDLRPVVGNMTQTALVIAFLGVFIAVLGWVMGRSRPARGSGARSDSMNASARAQLASAGSTPIRSACGSAGSASWCARSSRCWPCSGFSPCARCQRRHRVRARRRVRRGVDPGAAPAPTGRADRHRRDRGRLSTAMFLWTWTTTDPTRRPRSCPRMNRRRST